ncbi:MAG: hypothetical protein H6581_03810 [Bacteroidia bacterium]|nr:hypothetical protein [Bacteroidia bacterium]
MISTSAYPVGSYSLLIKTEGDPGFLGGVTQIGPAALESPDFPGAIWQKFSFTSDPNNNSALNASTNPWNWYNMCSNSNQVAITFHYKSMGGQIHKIHGRVLVTPRQMSIGWHLIVVKMQTVKTGKLDMPISLAIRSVTIDNNDCPNQAAVDPPVRDFDAFFGQLNHARKIHFDKQTITPVPTYPYYPVFPDFTVDIFQNMEFNQANLGWMPVRKLETACIQFRLFLDRPLQTSFSAVFVDTVEVAVRNTITFSVNGVVSTVPPSVHNAKQLDWTIDENRLFAGCNSIIMSFAAVPQGHLFPFLQKVIAGPWN